MKVSCRRILQFFVLCVMCISVFNVSILNLSAIEEKDNSQKQIVKVGWFEKSSTFLSNHEGMKTGYGYDYLQELARFGGWDYEYVSVTSQNCLQMLAEGKIDILGPIGEDQRLAKKYSFMKEAIFEDYTVLATDSFDQYLMDDFASFSTMKIGAIKNDLKIQYLEEYAKEHQFQYELLLYDTQDEIQTALDSNLIDAKLSSYASLNERDVIISKFNHFQFKFLMNKDNTELLNAFDQAYNDIERLNPSFKLDMENKHFQGYKRSTLAFTKEEDAYLKANPKISITLASLRKPIMFKDEGEYKGICIDILKEVEKRLGVTFEFVEIDNQLNAVKEVQKHEVDVVSNVYADFGWAETNGLYLSVPYFDMDYAAITKENSNVDSTDAKVAAVKGYLFSIFYVLPNYNEDQIIWYNSEEECVDAVLNGDADICFTNTYVANTYVQDIHYKGLHSSLINFYHGVSLAVSKEADDSTVLISILDKAINSISKQEVYRYISKHTMFVENYDLSLEEMIDRSPMTFIIIFGIFLLIISLFTIAYFVLRNNRIKKIEIYKAKLESQRDSITGLYNRASLEVMMSECLEKGSQGTFVMIDLDNFKEVNDTMGHDFGDQYLIHFADELKKEFKNGELLSRMGGDEFSIYFPQHMDKELLIDKIDKFQKSCSQSDGEYRMNCSIGICFVSSYNNTFDQCYKEADLALYEAKNRGKNQFYVYQKEND